MLEPLGSFARHQHRLAKAQRQMVRKTKFGRNWLKARARVQRIHRQIGNARNDYLNKATHAISKSHVLACIEDLQVSNMSWSAKGSAEQPERNVRQKTGLNRSILDQGWSEFRRQLDTTRFRGRWPGWWLCRPSTPASSAPNADILTSTIARPNRCFSVWPAATVRTPTGLRPGTSVSAD